MPPQSKPTGQGKGLCLLSLDAGGSRAISQLKILAELMHRFNFDAHEDQKQRPCDVFDMIGGTGSGGFIAILLSIFGLGADQALDEFIDLSVKVLESQGVDAAARTAALVKHIDGVLERHGIGYDRWLLDSDSHAEGCKLVVPIAYKNNVGTPCVLHNFETHQKKTTNLTVAQALLATLSTPPLFNSTSVLKDFAAFEYIGGDLTLSNPTREVISEAYTAFGPEERVACLLSVGCGHPGVISASDDSSLSGWNALLESLAAASEQKAQDLDVQMGHLGIYHRLRVSQGLAASNTSTMLTPGEILAHTSVYLGGASVSRGLEQCSDSLKLRDGAASLEQLKHSGGQSVLQNPLPQLTKAFVMRKEPWEFIEKTMLGSEEKDGPRMLAVTGIGGCGKTQLILKFMRMHKSKFGSMLFVDGSSATRIRADIIRHVRSLGTEHSQKNFNECLLFLAQPTSDGPRLVVYDNVDDPQLDLPPLLPPGEHCAVITTSRNRSVGELCPEAHLELDKMTTAEAIQLLSYNATSTSSTAGPDHGDIRAIAEALGCLPIALQQARSYIFQTKCSARTYLERLSTSRESLLAQPLKYQRDMRYLSTYAAFEASSSRLHPRVRKLLKLLSFFHWSKFPLELIILAAKCDFSNYEWIYADHGEEFYAGNAVLKEIFLLEGKWDATNLDEMMVSLQYYSLVTLISGIDTVLLEMHPLLHGWMLFSLNEEDRAQYQSAAVLLAALGNRSDYTPVTQYLASHISHLSPTWDKLHLNNAVAFGMIMREAGLLKEALLLQERAVSESRKLDDANRSNRLDPRWGLARTYQDAGRHKDSEALWVEILKSMEDLLGKHHPDTIMASSNLAVTYRDLGRLKEAGELQEEVLKLRKELLGEHHPDSITASSNLALTYHDLGRLKEAEALQERVMQLRKEILGEFHPDTITAFSNLAFTQYSLGRLQDAKLLQEEVLKLRRDILGERHPDTITASGNLALTYCDLGQSTEAMSLQEEVLKLRREVLGWRHPDTCSAMLNLAGTYESLAKKLQALYLVRTAEIIIVDTLGPSHQLYMRCQWLESRLFSL